MKERQISIFDRDEFNQRLFFPTAIHGAAPAAARDLTIEVPGARLHLRWHRAPTPRPTLLLFHGNGEVVADYDRIAPAYAAAGVDLAVVDFRGYGASTGRPTLRNTIEDAPRVLSALIAQDPPAILVMGRSAGSACAGEIYGAPAPPRVRGVILESGFTDLAALIRRRGLEPPPAFTAHEIETFDPLPKLRRGRLPLLVLHGEEDDLISPAEGRAACAAAGTPDKTLVLIPGLGHNDLSSAALYWNSLRSFAARLAPPEG